MKWQDKMNLWGKEGKPFVFVVDFLKENVEVLTVEEAASDNIFFAIEGNTNYCSSPLPPIPLPTLQFSPPELTTFEAAFRHIQNKILAGDTYLLNYSVSTPITIPLSLRAIFESTQARYKLWFKDKFVVFSPECFVQIRGQKIFTYPVKGTMRADVPNAEKLLLENEKELDEHATVVDLLRNDVGMVATNVRVNRFRFAEKLRTNRGDIWQMTSEIEGTLSTHYKAHLGDMMDQLLPAGSISGAPKKKTIDIIQKVEHHQRGYYTGVFGYFDGNALNSGVMIRFIEKQGDHFFYKSGGGITYKSDVQKEYQELLDKIYLPI